MIRYVFFTLSFLALAEYSVAQTSFDKVFVSQQWLEKNNEQLNIVLLHVGSEEDFNTSHIKGAQLITSAEFSTAKNNLRWEIPALEDFQETLERHGVTDESINILYYGSGLFAPTFRLYFTMKYYGLSSNTFILDGGLPGWIAMNKSVSIAASPAVAKGHVNLVENPSLVIDKESVLLRISAENSTIIDARNPNYYTGEEDGDGYYKRSGHIPSAVNVTWTTLLDNNRFLKPERELRKIFEDAGVESESKVITYCHVGLRATVLFTISELLGYEAQLYDGSFNEWDTLSEDFPVEKGKN